MDEKHLEHHGVLGMKWGVHKARKAASVGDKAMAKELYSKAFTKASQKAAKNEKRVYKRNQKAAKQRVKTDRRLARPSFTDFGIAKERRVIKKAARMNTRARRAEKAAYKWEKRMGKTFSEVRKSDLSNDAINAGRKYVHMLKI